MLTSGYSIVMIKPILYHSFEEKARLEAELFGKLTPEERERATKAWAAVAVSVSTIKKGRNGKNRPRRKK